MLCLVLRAQVFLKRPLAFVTSCQEKATITNRISQKIINTGPGWLATAFNINKQYVKLHLATAYAPNNHIFDKKLIITNNRTQSAINIQ